MFRTCEKTRIVGPRTEAMTTMCSGCGADVLIRVGVVEVDGREAEFFDDGDLLTWDCPACGYADSFWEEGSR